MCGGSGTRVWPELRESLPKQFIPLIGDRSTFQSIVERRRRPRDFRAAGRHHQFRLSLPRRRATEGDRRRGDDPARAGTARQRRGGRRRGGLGGDARPQDHRRRAGRRPCRSKTGSNSRELCAQAGVAAAAGEIVTFGVTPDHPATGYGYIHPGEPLSVDPQVRRVERFVEKPNEERAQDLHRAAAICGTRAISYFART